MVTRASPWPGEFDPVGAGIAFPSPSLAAGRRRCLRRRDAKPAAHSLHRCRAASPPSRQHRRRRFISPRAKPQAIRRQNLQAWQKMIPVGLNENESAVPCSKPGKAGETQGDGANGQQPLFRFGEILHDCSAPLDSELPCLLPTALPHSMLCLLDRLIMAILRRLAEEHPASGMSVHVFVVGIVQHTRQCERSEMTFPIQYLDLLATRLATVRLEFRPP